MGNLAATLAMLRPVQAVNPIARASSLASLQNMRLQGQDIAAQVQERQADAQQKQVSAQQAQAVQKVISDHLSQGGAMDDSLVQKLYSVSPVHAEALQKSLEGVAKSRADRANLESETKTREGALEETKNRNLFEQMKERDAQARLQAQEAAGTMVPGTEFTNDAQERAAQFRVRQQDGSYVNEMRSLGKQGAAPVAPPQPRPPMSPELYRQELGLKNSGEAAAAVSLTPAGLDAAALSFAKTGQLPPMGMGAPAAGVRSKIINRAAEMFPDLDVASNKAGYGADAGSLKKLQSNRDAIVSFENTATKNLDQFMATAKNVIDSGSPWINKPLRSIGESGLGSKDLAAFQAARRVAVNEIAKVTSNPNLSGQLSDAARREVESFIPENATLKQIYAVADILKRDMKNRHDALDEQIQTIGGRIKAGPGGAAPKADPLEIRNIR